MRFFSKRENTVRPRTSSMTYSLNLLMGPMTASIAYLQLSCTAGSHRLYKESLTTFDGIYCSYANCICICTFVVRYKSLVRRRRIIWNSQIQCGHQPYKKGEIEDIEKKSKRATITEM